MSILKEIVSHKRLEVDRRTKLFPVEFWTKAPLYQRETQSLSDRLRSQNGGGIIAEFKRRSPSKPSINAHSTVDEVTKGYQNAGVSGMSVLTDSHFFGGSLDDLVQARASCSLPLLRKDFTIDPYQVHEAKAHGADVILLIAAILSPDEASMLASIASSLGLECLLEVHTREELLEFRSVPAALFGVNNRNLKTFKVDIGNSLELFKDIPDTSVAVSESGLDDTASLKKLNENGYHGFLMGEHFMKADLPGKEAERFIQNYHRIITAR